MTLPSSGPLDMNAINVEFARGLNLNAYRGTVWYTDAGATGTFSSGAISISEFYGKRPTSPAFVYNKTFTTNTLDFNLQTSMAAAGWNGTQSWVATLTVNAGVWVYTNSQGNSGIFTGSSLGSGTKSLTIINNGVISGCGGDCYFPANRYGGAAIFLRCPATIVNNGYIAGGGGGGGGDASQPGAGAGGGISNSLHTRAAPGATGTNGGVVFSAPGGCGGRILPGSGGSAGPAVSRASPSTGYVYGPGTGGGAGGGGGTAANRSGTAVNTFTSGVGGAGGGGGSAGGSATAGTFSGTAGPGTANSGGGGGGWGASGGAGYTRTSTALTPNAGNSGGRAIQLNGNTVSLSGSGTTYGAVS